MDDNTKAERDKAWADLKKDLDALAAAITAFYAAVGSTRTSKLINELWRAESPSIGIGFVPPEAKDQLESMIEKHRFTLVKGNGPLGKGVYFGFALDAQLNPERLNWLTAEIEKNTLKLKDAPPPAPTKKVAPTAERVIEEQVARLEGLIPSRRDQPKTRPAEVAEVVDAFNRMTIDLGPLQAISILADAVAYFNLPETSIRELQRTLDMMRDAETKI
jgi:hypothetical protein